MKKFISLLLCAVMLLVPVTAFAADYPAETLIKMGDVNLDGKINASDARLALRMSANLESSADTDLLSVDADGNGRISSADARLILRKAADLSEFTYGFDGNGVANSLNVLKSNTFVLGVSYDDMSFRLVKQGENIHIIGSDMGMDMSSLGMKDCGILLLGDNLYATFINDLDNGETVDIAMYISEELYEKFEISADDIHIFADDITNLFPDEFGAPEKIEENGEVKYVYSANDGNSQIIVDAHGIIQAIGAVDVNGNMIETVVVTDVSAEIANNYFDINRFEIL